jgi:malate synthase
MRTLEKKDVYHQPQDITAAEIRELFAELHTEIAELRAELHAMRGGLQTAATPPAVGTFGEMMIDTIVMTYDDAGKPAYKAKGAPYQKHGVRIWDEVLPTLDIDPAALKPGPNAIEPIRARVQMNPPTEEGKTAQPRKVTGKA